MTFDLSQRRIVLANQHASLVGMLRALDVNVDVPPEGSSVKIHCPFGEFHSDGGAVKAFRIYATNTGYCFECQQFFNPAILEAKLQGFDLNKEGLSEAASILLSKLGIPDMDIEEILGSGIESMISEPSPDLYALLAALLERVPQFDVTDVPSSVAPIWGRIQTALLAVRTSADAFRWLSVAQRRLIESLQESRR